MVEKGPLTIPRNEYSEDGLSCIALAASSGLAHSEDMRRESWRHDDLDIVTGKRDQLIGLLPERCSLAKEQDNREPETFVRGLLERQKAVRPG
jgi:hypothetical protein